MKNHLHPEHMSIPNIKERVSEADKQAVIKIIAQMSVNSRQYQEWLGQETQEKGTDFLLNHPFLMEALMEKSCFISYEVALLAWTRHECRKLGISDMSLADYVASLVAAFGEGQRAWRLTPAQEEKFTTMHDLLIASESRDQQRAFLAQVHMGNYALWLTGIFPDWVGSRRWRRGGPDLAYFQSLGETGWQKASNHKMSEMTGMRTIFIQGQQNFGKLRLALNHLSDSVFWPQVYTAEKLIRQVETMMNLGEQA